MTKQKSAVYVWDFTGKAEGVSVDQMKKFFKEHCKKWAFSIEKGEKTGYEHYQCRVSFKSKTRSPPMAPCHGKWTPTHEDNIENEFYVLKEDTRLAGPWTDRDKEVYIPRQYRGKENTLFPWQQTIWDQLDSFDERKINVVVDPIGCQGKSVLCSLAMLHKNGYWIPSENDGLKLIQSVCDMLMANEDHQPGPMFVDLPRAMDQRELLGMYRAVEQIKAGRVYELRNKFAMWWFDSPQIWVFCNTVPILSALTEDRWTFWKILPDKTLIRVFA